MTESNNEEAAAVPDVVQAAREQPAGALLPSRSGVLPALPDYIADADVPALLEDIARRVEALPGAFEVALARKQVVAVNAVAVAMQAHNLRRVTERALALIEARLAALIPANPPGRPPQPVGKPDGQPAGFDAREPDRGQPSALAPDPPGRPPQPVGKPDGQLAGFDAREPDRGQLPSARTMRDIRAAHPNPADKHALRERMDRLENRGDRVSRRALTAEVRSEQTEQTEPADAPGVDGLPEPVADTRPLPVVHHADVDEHPLDTGSVDAVALDAPEDLEDLEDLDPYCPFTETVLRPGGVLLLRCEAGAEDAISERVIQGYDNGTSAALAYQVTLAMVHGGHWWPVLVFVRLGDDAHIPDRTAYVGDDERACWRAIVADWTYPADGLVCDPCADDGRILGAADATKLRAVGLCPDKEQVDSLRAEVARARGAPQE